MISGRALAAWVEGRWKGRTACPVEKQEWRLTSISTI